MNPKAVSNGGVEYPPLWFQIREKGWRGSMFSTPENRDPNVVYFNPAIRYSLEGNHLFARECTWSGHWSNMSNRIVRFDIKGNDLVNLKAVGFDKLHPTESWEDPRIFAHDDMWHIAVASWYKTGDIKVNQTYAIISETDDAIDRKSPVFGGNGKNLFWQTGNEKNWGYFTHEGRLRFVYGISPNHVVATIDEEGLCSHTECPSNLAWKWDQIRGGTPPILIDGEYVAFFHSSIPWKTIPKYGLRRRYFMGAYAFEAKPPFRITRYTPEYLLAGSEHDVMIPGSPAVVFPCGAALVDGSIVVTYGSNDCECGWVSIPKSDLFARMITC